MVQIFESSSNVKFSCKAFLEILGHKISEQMSDICQSESSGRFVEESMSEKVLRFILQFVEEYKKCEGIQPSSSQELKLLGKILYPVSVNSLLVASNLQKNVKKCFQFFRVLPGRNLTRGLHHTPLLACHCLYFNVSAAISLNIADTGRRCYLKFCRNYSSEVKY